MPEEKRTLPIKVNLGTLYEQLCPECQKKMLKFVAESGVEEMRAEQLAMLEKKLQEEWHGSK